MEYYRRIEGRDVWVTVQRPLVYDEDKNLFNQREFCSLFKIDVPPAMILSEYVRQADGELRWFDTENAAREAAFDQAWNRIQPDGSSRPL